MKKPPSGGFFTSRAPRRSGTGSLGRLDGLRGGLGGFGSLVGGFLGGIDGGAGGILGGVGRGSGSVLGCVNGGACSFGGSRHRCGIRGRRSFGRRRGFHGSFFFFAASGQGHRGKQTGEQEGFFHGINSYG